MPEKLTKRQYHHGNLPEALKKAALELIERKGVTDFTLREATQLAGVTHTAPYKHFADRESLLAAIAEDGFRLLLDGFDRALRDAGDDPVEQYLAIGGAYMVFALSKPAYFRLMFGPHSPDRQRFTAIHELDLKAYQICMDVIAEGQRRGVMRPGDVRELGIISFSVMYGLAGTYLDGQMTRLGLTEAETDRVFETFGAVLLDGARPRNSKD